MPHVGNPQRHRRTVFEVRASIRSRGRLRSETVTSVTEGQGRTALVVFTRDLRVHDHPALGAALRDAELVVPAFVFDDEILASDFGCANRVGFLLEALADLDATLGSLGGALDHAPG